jgi:tetratricopeptide (TPR) repeat protein
MIRPAAVAAIAIGLCAGTRAAAQSISAQERAVLHQAKDFVAAKQLEQANQLLSEYAQEHPKAVAVLVELGSVQLQQKLNDDAMQTFAAALTLDPHRQRARAGEVKAAVESALADRNAGENDLALSCLLKGLKLEPDSVELLVDFGIQADAMRIYQDADKALTHAHTLEPENARALYALAHVELDEQKMSRAEADLKAYLKLRPDDATAYYGLGHLLHMLDKDDEAEQALERSIALQPQQTESYYELGEIALNAHQDADAKKEYEHVLAADPAHGGALTGMGVLAFRMKEYSEAAEYLRKAVLYAPEYVKAHQFYAMTLDRLGQKDKAKDEFAVAQSLAAEQSRTSRGYHLLTSP